MADVRVCILGAGVAGLSAALQLTRRGAQVTVLDRDHVAAGSSSRSIGVVGSQLLDPMEIELRVWGVHFLGELESFGLEFTRTGYLRLGHSQDLVEPFERSVELQHAFGLHESRLVTPAEIATMIPDLLIDDVAVGLFGPQNGFVDGHLYCGVMAELAESGGASILSRQTVIGLEKSTLGNCVLTSSGGRFECDFVVNAAGPWAGLVGDRIGAPIGILPEKARAAFVDLGRVLPYTMPLVMDFVPGVGGSGLNFRHDRPGHLVVELHTESVSSVEGPDEFVASVEPEFYQAVAAQLHKRLPGLRDARLGAGWAGLYPMSIDGRGLVGPHPDDPTVMVAAGLSGYGIQLSPAVGNLVTEWILDGGPATLASGGVLSPSHPGREILAQEA